MESVNSQSVPTKLVKKAEEEEERDAIKYKTSCTVNQNLRYKKLKII